MVRQAKTAILGDVTQEGFWKLQHDAAAVTRLAVRRHRAAMRQPRQRLQRRLNQPVALLAIHVREEGEAATVPEVPVRVMKFGRGIQQS